MRINILKKRAIISLAVLATAVTFISLDARAGGPNIINTNTGQPIRWSRFLIQGGPLNTQTVDAQGRVLYRVDSGPLGPLSNEAATALTDRIFREYTDIPTASIEYVNAGRILNPSTGQPIDVTGANFGVYLGELGATFQNPIIFDSDGSVVRELTGDNQGLILGLAGVINFTPDDSAVSEAVVVLNGRSLTQGLLSTTSFLGVFTHEFGHFAGPLDHSQINGSIADPAARSISVPAGFTAGQAYDLYAPFMETMYPFVFDPPSGSQLASQFADTGFFIASLDMDTQNALSNLYPTADYIATNGSIQGRVILKTSTGDIPITGINVIARRVSQGGYVPPLGTLAFLALPVATDGDGVPELPPAQTSTDSLATVSSAVTGLEFGAGTYRIQGLPPGNYMVQFQQIDPGFVGGSGIGPLFDQLPLPIVEEFFNGPNSSSNSASTFTPVTVNAGSVTNGIDLILNGFSTAPLVVANESEPNHKKKKAQKLTTFPLEIRGNAASTDSSVLNINLGEGASDKVEDLYRITVNTEGIYAISLESISGAGDLDLWLFDSAVNKKRSSLDDDSLLGLSITETSTEFVMIRLTPGNYYIGVSAFTGTQAYRLRITLTN
ncbi:MAG TPA: pre-peptidase C-terminal domain-containing protein [Blastocatellia bacterium]|nr:pre-peptidase C-terminal domain-containing protein [Blastocatellia bacterium]